MEIRIFGFDGYRLYWVDEGVTSPGAKTLEFEKLEDAIWAQIVWENFLNGKPDEPVLCTNEDGSVSILA